MVSKKYKEKELKEYLKKSAVGGLTVLVLDWIVHTYYANPETFLYFLAKPFISGYVAFYMFKFKARITKALNIFSLRNHTHGWYLYGGFIFALIHGIYYRGIELYYTKAPLFSRVGTIEFFGIVFPKDNLLLAILGWLIVHGGAFYIGVLISKRFIKK